MSRVKGRKRENQLVFYVDFLTRFFFLQLIPSLKGEHAYHTKLVKHLKK